MKLRSILLCGALSAATLPAADTLTEEFQRALFEEEANRNLPAAIAGYESVIKRLDEQRQLAATAVFRLGESYRKLGKTNEAVSAYERIIREFADQETLVKLSGQNLSILRPVGDPLDTYVVQPGDTLSRIARQYNVSTRNLEEWNPGLDFRRFRVGDRIRVGSRILESPFYANASAPGSATAADLAELRRLEILLETVRSLEPMSEAELRTLLGFAPDENAATRINAWMSSRVNLEQSRKTLQSDPENRNAVETLRREESFVRGFEAWFTEWRSTTLRMLEARVEAARRLAGREWSEGQSSSASQLDPATRARQKELLEQELALLASQLAAEKKQVEVGTRATEELIPRQRDILRFQRQLAALDHTQDSIDRQRAMLGTELGLVDQLIEVAKRRHANGVGTREELRSVERERLQVERELISLDQQASLGTANLTAEAASPVLDKETLKRQLELLDAEIALVKEETNRLGKFSNLRSEFVASQRELLQLQRDRAALFSRLNQDLNATLMSP